MAITGNMIENPLGTYIKALRIDKGLTQKMLGDLCGVSQTSIGVWESGSNRPTVENLHSLSGALGVPVSTLREKLIESVEAKIHVRDVKSETQSNEISEDHKRALLKAVNNSLEDIGRSPVKVDSIKEFAAANIEGCSIDVQTRTPSGVQWDTDFENANFVFVICTSWNPNYILQEAYHLASYRAWKQDDRGYYVIAIEDEPLPESRITLRLGERILKTHDAEASMLGVQIERVRNVQDAIETIMSIQEWHKHVKAK
jgi:transcriptional regulator with XRE-family HTH domain